MTCLSALCDQGCDNQASLLATAQAGHQQPGDKTVQHHIDGIGEEGAAAEVGYTSPTGTADGKKSPKPPLNSLRPAARPGL